MSKSYGNIIRWYYKSPPIDWLDNRNLFVSYRERMIRKNSLVIFSFENYFYRVLRSNGVLNLTSFFGFPDESYRTKWNRFCKRNLMLNEDSIHVGDKIEFYDMAWKVGKTRKSIYVTEVIKDSLFIKAKVGRDGEKTLIIPIYSVTKLNGKEFKESVIIKRKKKTI